MRIAFLKFKHTTTHTTTPITDHTCAPQSFSLRKMLTREQRKRKHARRGDEVLLQCRETIEELPEDTPFEKLKFGMDLLLLNSRKDFDWFTIVEKDGEYIVRPRYESCKWFLQQGWSFETFRKIDEMEVWDPLGHWMDWLSISLVIVSTHHVPRIGARSPIRVLPLELIVRLKGFLLETFPDRRQGEFYTVCMKCRLHIPCKVCGICRYCPDKFHCVACYIGPTHLRCVRCVCCFDCGGRDICHECKRCAACVVREDLDCKRCRPERK
jgi:hypothetical protein